MIVNTLTLTKGDFPEVLRHIPMPPTILYVAGDSLQDLLKRPLVTIVGSRKVTSYGKAVTARLAGDLARAGVVIISGLAIGVDAIAHTAALEAGGLTIAVLPSSLESIYPRRHYQLAQRIIGQGGALITEYPPGAITYPSNFIARNRIASGLSQVTIITEATQKSGTLHTARFALEQGKEVMAVPGNITSPTSMGTNTLIRAGAQPVTGVSDVFHVLGIEPSAQVRREAPKGDTSQEQKLLDLLYSGIDDGAELAEQSSLAIQLFNQTLTMLEITGKVRSLGNNKWTLA